MRIITLWQPWASLIFATNDGVPMKRHETRSFRCPPAYRGEVIGIHAAKTFPASKHISGDLADLCYDAFGCAWNHSLPLGAILGTVRLGECAQMGGLMPAQPMDDEDRISGDWTPGRFAWRLHDPAAFPEPIYAAGKQGWWSHPLNEQGPA